MRNYEQEYNHLNRLYNSLVEANVKANVELVKAVEHIKFLEAQLVNCQSALDISKNTLSSIITNDNALKNQYIERIQELESKLNQN